MQTASHDQTGHMMKQGDVATTPVVLVVDDDEVDRMNMKRLLGKAGYEVMVAPSASTGLEIFSENSIDCVLLDYFIPGMHGINTLEAIRKVDQTTPVIIVTGQGDEMVAVDAMKHGAVDYLPKDELSPDILRSVVGRAIDHSMTLRSVSYQSFQLENYAHLLAHEVREPLRTIRAHLRVVQSQCSENIGSVGRDHLRQVSELLSNVESQIEGAVESSPAKEQEEEKQSSTRSAKLVFMIRRATDALEKELVKRGLDIDYRDLPDLYLSPRFSQLFQNLFMLYVDFSDVTRVQLKAEEKNEMWKFGLIPASAEKDADATCNINSLAKKLEEINYQDSIGLPLCKHLVESMGGRMWCNRSDKLEIIGFSLPKEIISGMTPAHILKPH